ncbi:MAG: adenosine kinase [Spirochaetota bacterium]
MTSAKGNEIHDYQKSSRNQEMRFDVSGMGNPLVDLLVSVDDDFITSNQLAKGIMHLIEKPQKDRLVDQLKEKETRLEAGGACFNTVSALSLLGADTAVTGKIGTDEFGNIFEKKLTGKHVFSFLKKESGDTGVSIVLITPDKERTMNTYLGNCRKFARQDVPSEMILNSRYFYFTGYMWDTPSQKEATRYALDLAKQNGVQIVFDAADPFAVKRNREDFLRLIENDADIALANAQEAELLTGKNVQEAVENIGQLCSIAVVKNGAEDTFIWSSDGLTRVPSFRGDVQDTTGAGDNFAAGFIYGLLQGYQLHKCGKLASFVALKAIERIGSLVPDNIKELVEEIL